MSHSRFPSLSLLFALALSAAMPARGGVVINEIMYRPGTGFPENTAREFIEVLNTDPVPVDVSGWAFTDGVSFTFPAGTILPAGGYAVVAADPAAVQSLYGITGVLGPWQGTLSNNGERITLSRPDPTPGAPPGSLEDVDRVEYASEGDWATRIRETNFGGWDWSTPANGLNRSMELRNAAVSNDNGQNWAPSTGTGGATPKAVNSTATGNIAPIIRDVEHSPAVPTSTEPVTISCELTDETAPAGLTATLFWRNATTASPGPFQSVPMAGSGGDKFSATLAPFPHLNIIEFYVSASDGTNTRTWPAPTSEGQNANAQYQVTNDPLAPGENYYFLVLTGAENAAYNATAPQDSAGNKIDRQFNTTIIVASTTGSSIRYRSSIRFRGNSSRSYQFKPLRVSIPVDDRLNDVSDFNLHPRGSYLQYIGFRAFQAAGVRVPDAVPVELRRNGIEYTSSSGGTADFGKWVRVEDIGGDFIDNHWPEANGGNAYRKTRPDQFWRATQPAPPNPNSLLDGWSKQNNSSANDWSDLRGFFQTWQTVAAPHFTGENVNDVHENGVWNGTAFSDADIATLSTVSDLDQWARWFAVMTILQDFETNISNGQDDDYAAYFEPNAQGQRRMHLIPHDLDTVLGRGDTTPSPTQTGLYDVTDQGSIFTPLLPLFGNDSAPGNAAFRTKYHNAIRELYGTVFNADTASNPNPAFHAFLDNHLGGWVPAATIGQIKTFATQRQAHLLGLIGAGPITPPSPTSTGTLTSPHGPLMISEVLASNVAASPNGATFPDVIELHNSGAAPVDLTGMTLSDDATVPGKYAFPAGTTIPAGGFLLVYADSDTTAPGLHAGFALDQDGDEVRLYNGGAPVDAIVFGPQVADLSISRTGAALDVWALTAPTLGAANGAPVALAAVGGVKINELFTNPDYLSGDDFVEIYNPATQPAALGGVTITDDFINYPGRHALPPLSFIGARGYLVLHPKGNDASAGNPTELPFKFSSDSTWAGILGANGTIIDQLDTNALPPDVSRGRSPDGGAALVNFGLPTNIPTPGAANVAPPAGILALLNQLRVTELLYKPNNLEFIELQNIGPAALDLSGVRFITGITYTFPAGISLAPGAFIVICKDRAAFTAQYGSNVPLAPGVFAGTLDNAGETIGFQPPPPWNVNILRFAYENDWYPLTEADHSLVVRDAAVSFARDWDEKETWDASPQPLGNPGAGAPPTITGPLTASGTLSTAFSYQIVATQAPTMYSAAGLPAGLSIDTGTGLISGMPTEVGVFNVIIGASNGAGSDSETLVIRITDAGPLAGFEWSAIASPQTAGVPFTVTLRARDAAGRTVTTFNGQAQISAQQAGASSTVVFTEFGTSTPTPDYFEIQNVTAATLDTAGWFVLTNASSAGVNSAAATSWPLPASLAAGQLTGATDGAPDPNETAYGGQIDWPGNAPRGWAMLVDNTGVIRDFVAWGYSATEISSINFPHSGFNFTVGTQWSGNGASTMPGGQSLFRGGASDNHRASDWELGPTPSPRVTQNPGLTVPMLPQFTPISGVPTGPVDLVNGIWTGSFTVREVAGNVELQAVATGFPIARSNTFGVVAPTSNTPPTFVKGADQSVPEDSPAQVIANWATEIFPGASTETGAQSVSFLVTSDNDALFSSLPAVDPNGTLRFTPAANANGIATVSVRARDTGGTANGGNDTSAPQTFTITVLSVNDAPTIIAGPNVSALQNSGTQTLPGWATGIGGGSADETGQTLVIQLTATNPSLFAAQPVLALDGTLSFTLNSTVSGTSNVTITVTDSGGTANGGVDRTQRMFTITSRPVNLPPSFLAGGDVTAPVLAVYSEPWATDISPGPPSESGQTLTFLVTTDHPEVFAIPPTISPSGVLTFQGSKQGGTATVTVVLKDNGGIADGGIDSSAPQTFLIDVLSAAAAGGKYRGLIEAPLGTPPSHAQLGRVEINISRKGGFTGKVQLGRDSYAIRGKIDGTGGSLFGRRNPALQLKRKGLAPLLFSFRAEVIESNPRLVAGEITDGVAIFARFAAEPDGYGKENRVPIGLLNPGVNKGNYTAVFQALPAPNGGLTEERYPQGDGWTTLRVTSKGGIKLRGRFADGSKFTYSSALNTTNGFSIYVPLYRKGGAVGGKAGFSTTDPVRLESNDGLIWFRPALGTPLYPQGWPSGIVLGFDGTPRNVVTEPNALPVGNATLTLAGGNLPAPGLMKQLVIGPNNRVTVQPAGADKMEIKLKPSGELSGNFIHPVTGRKTTLSGAALRDPSEASGFFLGSSESGLLLVQPTAP